MATGGSEPSDFSAMPRLERQGEESGRSLLTPLGSWGRGRRILGTDSRDSHRPGSDMPRVTVVMPKVKKVRKFHGNQDDKGYGVEEFIDKVCLASADKGNLVQFVLEHLEGTAKREVRTCGLPASSTKEIFSILREAFGDKRTLSEVSRSFMERVQDPYEGVREYASDIFDQFIGLQKKTEGYVSYRKYH
ncbi:hypothetical protein ACOMHN_041910 [Nucella lapillus]